MSQSCTSVPSAVPPLNLDDDINDMEMYDTDDPRRDVSLGYLGIGSRFSDISIGERKDRINNLISEIYCAAPLSSGNSSRKSLHQSIKRYASVDQVSDVDSVITGTTVVRYFFCMFLNPNIFFQFEMILIVLIYQLPMIYLQEQVKKAFCHQKLF